MSLCKVKLIHIHVYTLFLPFSSSYRRSITERPRFRLCLKYSRLVTSFPAAFMFKVSSMSCIHHCIGRPAYLSRNHAIITVLSKSTVTFHMVTELQFPDHHSVHEPAFSNVPAIRQHFTRFCSTVFLETFYNILVRKRDFLLY